MSDTAPPSVKAKKRQPAPSAGPTPSSWAVPTERDDEIWQSMTREQQLAALQDHFISSDCTTPSTRTVTEIVARARSSRSAS